MHLVIQPDGRTSRHGDLGDTRADIHITHMTDRQRAHLSLHSPYVLPLRCPPEAHGQFTLWVSRFTVTSSEGVRNTPAALLGVQWGLPLRMLAGPVVVTSTGSEASAHVTDTRWHYVEGLVEDITRATAGLPVHSVIHEPMWPEAIRLADAVMRDAVRHICPGAGDAEALRMLMLELDIPDRAGAEQ